MHREQRLVGGDDVLAGTDRIEHQRSRDAGAADQFDDDVDARVGDDRARIVDDTRAVADDPPCARDVEIGHQRDLDAAAGPTLNLVLVARQHVESAATDGTDAEQADLDRFGFDVTSLRDMSLRRNTSCCHVECRLR